MSQAALAASGPRRPRRLPRWLALGWLVGSGPAGCSDAPPTLAPSTSSCPGFVAGELGCPCTPEGGCSAGLMCVSWPRVCVAASGSGGSGGGGTGGSGATGTGGSAAGSTVGPACQGACAQPPAPPGGGATSGSQERVLAVSRLFLGGTDRAGNPAPEAWRGFGFDLDGLRSSRTDTNHCAPVAGASDFVKTDGDAGRDNSFGANLADLFDVLTNGLQASTDLSLAAGSFGLLVRLRDYAPAPDVIGVQAAWLRGAPRGAPLLDGTDVWPVAAESLGGTPPSLDTPLLTFGAAWVTGGVFVATAAAAPVEVWLEVGGLPLTLGLREATVVVDLSGPPPYAGTLSGLLPTEDFIAEFGRRAGAWDPSLCPGTGTFDSVANQFRSASDLMADGTNGDRRLTCDAISVGIGFEAVDAALGVVAAPEPTPADPCAP